MKLKITAEERDAITASLRRYCRHELDRELTQIESNFLLEYLEKEIAPLAYNQGVQEAQQHLLSATTDLPGVCFEEALTYWDEAGGNQRVRRKPSRS